MGCVDQAIRVPHLNYMKNWLMGMVNWVLFVILMFYLIAV